MAPFAEKLMPNNAKAICIVRNIAFEWKNEHLYQTQSISFSVSEMMLVLVAGHLWPVRRTYEPPGHDVSKGFEPQ